MSKGIFAALIFGLISLSGFNSESVNHEQIAFDYFFSSIFIEDFKNLSEIEFKGKTEDTFSMFRTDKFCLNPEERLQSLIEDVAKGPVKNLKEVKYNHVKNVAVTDFKSNSITAKLYVSYSVRVADNFYVFMSIRKSNEPLINYVFEVTPEGEVSRNCKMN